MTDPPYRPGFYCDVAVWIDGRLLNMTVDGALVRVYLEDALIWQQAGPEPLIFGRCAVQGNQFLTIHKGQQSGHAWLVGNGWYRDLGLSFPPQSVGIDGNNAYVVRSAPSYDRCGLITQPLPSPVPESSQGLSDVQPNGTLWWADQHRTLVIGGTLFHYPNVRGPVTVGQVDPPGIAAAVFVQDLNVHALPGDGSWRITRILDGDAYEPHVAVSPNGRVAICARTPRGAAYVTTTIQELSGG
jgi:hypothetical protein